MKTIIIVILTSILSFQHSFAQEEFLPGSEEMQMPFFGLICSNIIEERAKMKCSNDQLNDYIQSFETPEFVEQKKITATVVINLNLDENGKVMDVTVKKSSNNKVLDDLVLEHTKNMPDWSPEKINNVGIPSGNINIRYKFKPMEKKTEK